MNVEAPEGELAKFDEQHREYLVLRELKLIDIVKLAHLISPAKWSGLATPFKKSISVTPRFTALKNEAVYGRIKCQHSHRPLIDHAALISLADLLAFLATAGPEWEWLQRFARRWQGYQSGPEVVSEVPPALDGSTSKSLLREARPSWSGQLRPSNSCGPKVISIWRRLRRGMKKSIAGAR
jgi:hypothetical protein